MKLDKQTKRENEEHNVRIRSSTTENFEINNSWNVYLQRLAYKRIRMVVIVISQRRMTEALKL